MLVHQLSRTGTSKWRAHTKFSSETLSKFSKFCQVYFILSNLEPLARSLHWIWFWNKQKNWLHRWQKILQRRRYQYKSVPIKDVSESQLMKISHPKSLKAVRSNYYFFQIRIKLIVFCMKQRKTDKWSVRFLIQPFNPMVGIKECWALAWR